MMLTEHSMLTQLKKRSYFLVSIATAASHTDGRKRLFGEHLRILVKAVREHGRS